ncbi:MAG: HAMP domain-containing protein [Desulfobacterales bacterium]|nr:HAMP domain-containing protein [Desulfobacterales bacterium]
MLQQMMANIKIGKKIGIGFGIIIGITLIIGIITLIIMNNIDNKTDMLSKEYIPEVQICDEILRDFLLAIFDFRGYGLTGEESYLERGMKNFNLMKEYIKKAEDLAESSQHLKQLKEKLTIAVAEANKYEDLLNQTKEKFNVINKSMTTLDEGASEYMKNCYSFLNSQNESMFDEIKNNKDASALNERVKKINLANDIIDIGNSIRVANFKSQSKRELNTMEDALKIFDKIDKVLYELEPMVKKQENKIEIANIHKAADKYSNGMKTLLSAMKELNDLGKKREHVVDNFREILTQIAKAGIDNTIIISNETVHSITNGLMTIIVGFIIAIVLGIMFSLGITSAITKPIIKIASFVKTFGTGDLSSTLDIDTKDEIGDMTRELNRAITNLRNIMKKLADTSNGLSGSSEELSSVSSQMAASAEEMTKQSDTVAAASEQISASVGTVASAAEQASSSVSNIAAMTEEMSSTFSNVANSSNETARNVDGMAHSSEEIASNINTIAAAIEEMTASLNEVSKNTAKGSRVSQNANKRAQDINERMEVLVNASKQIGKVVGVIKDIADQTNMLALNATIEAAGAGEAGKGFAVVAGEVKELAKQSAEATDEIAGQVENIQNSTNEAVAAIEEISKIINEIAGINETIASAVEEQTATASEISKSVANNAKTVKDVSNNAKKSAQLVQEIAKSVGDSSIAAAEIAKHVDELSSGVREVANSSNEAAKGVHDISKNIQGISSASKETSIGASQTNLSSKELANMAAALSEIVKGFKL